MAKYLKKIDFKIPNIRKTSAGKKTLTLLYRNDRTIILVEKYYYKYMNKFTYKSPIGVHGVFTTTSLDPEELSLHLVCNTSSKELLDIYETKDSERLFKLCNPKE